MKTNHLLKICRLIQTAALSAGLGFGFPASADNTHSYIIDFNSKKVTELGGLGGGSTYATAINDAGQVVGQSNTVGGASHAFITGPNGIGVTDLGTLGGNNSYATAINAVGQVVGYSDTKEGLPHAFITAPGGVGMTDLGTLGGRDSYAFGINAAGQVVGDSSDRAFMTGPNGTGMTDLLIKNYIPEPGSSRAWGINNRGQVVGDYTVVGFITGPNGVGRTILGPRTDFIPSAVNDSGQAAGGYDTFQAVNGHGISHAFITGPNGVGATDLGTLGGYNSEASDIDSAGRAVGWSDMPDGGRHAFITGPNGVGMTDLNLLVSLPAEAAWNEATAINSMGQVVISGIPEPASYVLMTVGLGLMGFVSRRRKAGR